MNYEPDNAVNRRIAWVALCVAVLCGMLFLLPLGARNASGVRNAPSNVVIYAGGMSWLDVIRLSSEGRMPYITGKIRSEGSYGDVIAMGYMGEDETRGALFSGVLPVRHRSVALRSGGEVYLWDRLAFAGMSVKVIGSPDGESDTSDGMAELRSAFSSASEAVGGSPGSQVFVICRPFDGEPGAERDARYDEFDSAVSNLAAKAGPGSAFVVVSDSGFTTNRVPYRPYMPVQDTPLSVGFFAAWGSGIRHSELPHEMAPIDFAPTMLYLAGAPVPGWCDGRVLFGILDEDTYFRSKLEFTR